MAEDLITFDHLRAVLEDYGRAVAEQYKANLVRDGRPASGKLEKSITTHVEREGRFFVVQMDLEEYWKYIEHGTRGRKTGNPTRKFPPVDKLLQWIQVKPGFPRPATLEGKLKEARRIAGKIYWYGSKGAPSLQDAKETVTRSWRDRLEEALQHDIYDYILKVLP